MNYKTILKASLRYLLPLTLTVLLVIYMFRKVNFGEMMRIISQGVDYWWILLAMAISVFSHIFRAARWRLQLRAIGVNPPFMALCCSIFGCYALNLVFPRLGEVWRCTYITQRERAPFTSILGTFVADRLSDTLMVMALTLLTFIVANSAINRFLEKYPVGRDLIGLVENPWFWLALIGIVALVGTVAICLRHTRFMQHVSRMLRQVWTGFAAVASMKGRGQFLLYTICIWGCYYVQLYVAFFAFPFTRELCVGSDLAFGLVPCLVAFVLSAIGMAIPSNGGLGPWNIAVMFGLSLYGISDAQGTAFSMLQWSGQTVMLIILGIFTMAYIAISHNKKTHDAGSTLKSTEILR